MRVALETADVPADLVEGAFTLDDVGITTRYLNHPGLTLGYRLEGDGVVLVYATDHEPHARPHPDQPGETPGGALPVHQEDRGHIEFLRGADLIIHYAQYTAAEYAQKIGWGHSPVTYVVDVALAAHGKRLALFHHDPTRQDADLERVLDTKTVGKESEPDRSIGVGLEGGRRGHEA